MALVLAPIATLCVGRFGTKVTLSIGIVLQFVGLLGASWATEIWHLFLSQGLAFGFGMGFLFIASVGVVPQWFGKRRSFANSIATAGSGFGGLTYSLGTNAMIQSIGLGWAFRVLAIVACGVCVVCTVLIKDRNKAIGSVHMAFDVSLFRKPEFVLLLGWGFFSMLGCKPTHLQCLVEVWLIKRFARYRASILPAKLCDKSRTYGQTRCYGRSNTQSRTR